MLILKIVDIVFREKKNLIYIYVESLEMGNVSVENGGLFSDSIIPNMERLELIILIFLMVVNWVVLYR